ncbi:hypothetical protein B0H12DRAFT_304554 [Mycena haematopus]|nr:hypothetical protein B0H12DRAFT_304554 [Mycena haematopus]
MLDASLSSSSSSSSSCSSPCEAAFPGLTILPEDLPLPTAPRPFSTKKSHARKQPLGHIPKPRNAFILFRCDYSRQNDRKSTQYDQNDVSRLVGTIWRNMTREQRAPWMVLAEAEKKKHAVLYPGYKYTPRNRKSKPTEKEVVEMIAREAEKAVETEAVERATKANSRDMVTVYHPPWATRRTLTYFARRATSCPPEGAVSIEPYSEMMDRRGTTVQGTSITNARGCLCSVGVRHLRRGQPMPSDSPVVEYQRGSLFIPRFLHDRSARRDKQLGQGTSLADGISAYRQYTIRTPSAVQLAMCSAFFQ